MRFPALATFTLFLVAAAFRFYRLSYHPLWYDELYGYQLVELGPGAILRNSLVDPHPPLFYLLQWVGSGFGLLHSEWSLRWVAAASGVLTIVVLFRWTSRIVGQAAAFWSSLLFALLPVHLYFSQEARSTTWDVLLATASMAVLYQMQREAPSRRLWVGYVLVLLAGLYSSYGFGLIVVVQLSALALLFRQWRTSVVTGLVVALAFAPGLAMAVLSLRQFSAQHQASAPMMVSEMLVDLLGGHFRPLLETHIAGWLTAGFCLLALPALPSLLRHRDRPFLWYCVLQLLLPLFLVFGLMMAGLGMRLPTYEFKQFMLVLPALWVLFGVAIRAIRQRMTSPASKVFTAGLYAAMLVASLMQFQPYWTNLKDTAALPAQSIAPQMKEGDGVVAFHYALLAATSFYLPDVEPYTRQYISNPEEDRFHRTPYVIPRELVGSLDSYSLDEIKQHQRIWLLSVPDYVRRSQDALVDSCRVTKDEWYGPWQLRLLEDCR